uniref:Uncharacterized protein ORF-c08_009 n=1 Tax=Saccharolobus solfataricus TaxID=2287 RepID=Q9UX33_SACSO|nr:hypothetical protein [Saccharolobus solfataricus P2]
MFSIIVSLNFSLLSAFSIPSICVPNTLTLYFCNTPFLCKSTPTFNAVCPPNPIIIPSGLSFSITFSTAHQTTGNMYNLSANFLLVCTVATLEFTNTVSIPSSFNAFNA